MQGMARLGGAGRGRVGKGRGAEERQWRAWQGSQAESHRQAVRRIQLGSQGVRKSGKRVWLRRDGERAERMGLQLGHTRSNDDM